MAAMRKKRALNPTEHLQFRTIIKTLTSQKAPFKVMHETLLELFGENCPAPSTIKHWRKCFAFSQRSVHEKPKGGRPIEATTPHMINLVKRLVESEDSLQHRIIAGFIGVSASTVLRILYGHLQMKRRNSRWIPNHIHDDDAFTYKNENARRESITEILREAGIVLNIDSNSELYPYIATGGTAKATESEENGDFSLQDGGEVDNAEENSSSSALSSYHGDHTSPIKENSSPGQGGLVIAEVFSLSHPEEIEQKALVDEECAGGEAKSGPPMLRESTYVNSQPHSTTTMFSQEAGSVDGSCDPADEEELSAAKPIDSYKDALNYLGPLEQFALLKENIRVVGLINHIESIFRKEMDSGKA